MEGEAPTDRSWEYAGLGRDRRRVRRHRVHTPAYANLSGSTPGAPLELSEIINVSENGICIQATTQMRLNRLVPLSLELSATGARIQLVGHVVWSDVLGRTGIRFPEIAEAPRQQLLAWLEVNARAEAETMIKALAAGSDQESPATKPVPASAQESLATHPVPGSAYTSLVQEWTEIEREVELCGPDLDPALHLIAQRALTLTWASGTVIALINKLEPAEMICRARAGTDSPELGTRLEAGAGFSGECFRTGRAITSDDTDEDPRVDGQSCRALGIRSIVACPVKHNSEVVGILEAFSPEPAAFWGNDITILEKLASIIAGAVRRAEHAHADVLAYPASSAPSQSSVLDRPRPGGLTARARRMAVLLAAIGAILVFAWMFAPWRRNATTRSSSLAASSAMDTSSAAQSYMLANLRDLRKLAVQGDVTAQYWLGSRYAKGEGVKQDYHEAMRWFLRSAEQGDTRAQAKVAAWFWAGRGASQDYSKAYFWGLVAQAGGDETGRTIVQNSLPYLNRSQITAEQEQADRWLRSHHRGQASSESSR
jgi:putative methionine-R-sulfoxide reductase with GAF domain